LESCSRNVHRPDPMAMTEEDLERHRALLESERQVASSRPFLPIRENETVLRRSYKNQYSHNTYNAPDYGHRAFPMVFKGKYIKTKTKQPLQSELPAFQPVMSPRRLRDGFAAGDRVRHSVFG